jgi:hypothetical protein
MANYVQLCSTRGERGNNPGLLMESMMMNEDIPPTPSLMSNCSWGGTLPSPDDDNNMMLSSSPAPVLKGAHNCRSPEMQELLNDRRQWVNPCLPDLWLMTHRLQVQVQVHSIVPVGYLCRSLITIALPNEHVFITATNYSHCTAMAQP